jgi:hypothetical protein
VRVGEGESRAAAFQKQHDVQRGRFAHVADVFLMRDAEDMNVNP